MPKIRLDDLLVELGFFDSKEKARTCIMMNGVTIGGQLANKAGKHLDRLKFHQKLEENNSYIMVDDKLLPYVGRGAYKIEAAIKNFNINVVDKTCMDIGLSTGGFSDYLLQSGVKKILGIDVGKNQLAFKLKKDPRLYAYEGVNFKNFSEDILQENFLVDLVVVDVSFISIIIILIKLKELILQDGLKLKFHPDLKIICLIKPQFEAGKKIADKYKGVISDSTVRETILNQTLGLINEHGYKSLAVCDSPIKGHKGNQEYLALFRGPN